MSEAHGADPKYKVDNALAEREHLGSEGLAHGFMIRFIEKYFPNQAPSTVRILDVGCGLGVLVKLLREYGYDAYGLEPGGRFNDISPAIRPFIYNCYAHDFPKQNPDADKFHLIMSHGVIEHVGTVDGAATLAANFTSNRKDFIDSQISLLKPGGLLLTCGPNRLFFFDFQHGPQMHGRLGKLKKSIPLLKRLTIPWDEKNHLVSYDDLAKLVDRDRMQLLHEDQRDYLSLASLSRRPALAAIFRFYITLISTIFPRSIRKHFETHTLFLCRLKQGT